MRLISLFLSFLLITACLSAAAFADGHHHSKDGKSFTIEEIKPGFFFLQGKGGNLLASKGEDGLLLIDNDYAELSGALKDAIEKLGGESSLRYVLNTHWHGDHTGNNVMLGKLAQIVSHENVRKRLSTAQQIKIFGMETEPMNADGLPDLTYQSEMNIYFNGHKITLRHFPKSHTDGDTAVFFTEKNILHTGDLFFNGFFPFIDTENGGNVVEYAKTVSRLIRLIDDETIVVPGHGKLSNKKELEGFHRMLSETTLAINEMKSKGLSLDEAKSRGLGEEWEAWGAGFIKTPVWIQIVYQDLP